MTCRTTVDPSETASKSRAADDLPPSKFLGFLRDEGGATMVEYAMMVTLLSLVLLVAMRDMGGNIVQTFSTAEEGFND